MRILIELRHPAHFHHFRNMIVELQQSGNDIKILVSEKDILTKLLKRANFTYDLIGKNRTGMVRKLVELFRQQIRVLKICRQYKPDIMISRPSQTMTLPAFFFGIRTVVFAEDDFKTVRINGLLAYPFAKTILAPDETDLGIFSRKKIAYAGYQKLAYLHPDYFEPEFSKIAHLVKPGEEFYLLRLSRLTASHDISIKGISNELGHQLVKKLSAKGRVFISAERNIDKSLNDYRLDLPVEDIHHLMYYSSLLVADSQSMTMEAAMLGTPSVRFSDLAGRISVLDSLEKKYRLTFGIKANSPQILFKKIDELLALSNLREEFQARRQFMLKDKIDVTAFMVWFIDNHPESKDVMKNEPNFQLKFRNQTNSGQFIGRSD